MSKTLRLETILAHAGIKSDKATEFRLLLFIFQRLINIQSFGQSTGFDYTRTKNPTRATLEVTLAAIEKAKYASATSSGNGKLSF